MINVPNIMKNCLCPHSPLTKNYIIKVIQFNNSELKQEEWIYRRTSLIQTNWDQGMFGLSHCSDYRTYYVFHITKILKSG